MFLDKIGNHKISHPTMARIKMCYKEEFLGSKVMGKFFKIRHRRRRWKMWTWSRNSLQGLQTSKQTTTERQIYNLT